MKTAKNKYLASEDLAYELLQSQIKGHPTEEVCRYFRMIATHLLGSTKYKGYPKSLQEDLVSSALVKCCKNIHNFKPQYADRCFNYYTRCTEHAFWDVLTKHYKQLNIKRKLALDYADQIECIDPNVAKKIRDNQIEIREDGQ